MLSPPRLVGSVEGLVDFIFSLALPAITDAYILPYIVPRSHSPRHLHVHPLRSVLASRKKERPSIDTTYDNDERSARAVDKHTSFTSLVESLTYYILLGTRRWKSPRNSTYVDESRLIVA